ncbi:MAG: molybdopterin cofactor-binding domain-containing protein [Streptosporangiaceae bacterium]
MFLDRWGQRGTARRAVVVIASDGWERGDAALLGEQAVRLARLAHAIIWVNPHRGKSGFAPETVGIVDGAPLVHPNTTSNKCYTWSFESGAAGTGGAIENALAAAEVTVSRRFIQQRLSPSFMEPRSTVVQPGGDGITIWSATQIPHILRALLALTLGIPEHKVRAIAPDVGGGFGGKIRVTPEEVICVLVARTLDKLVKYTESRSETFALAIRAGVRADALKETLFAYPTQASNMAWML